MPLPLTLANAIKAINKNGMLLIFPIADKKDPSSLWSEFYPRTKMRWDWNDDNDDTKVADLWHLRTDLSSSGKIVYTKWFQGRATAFSKPMFAAMLRFLETTQNTTKPLSKNATNILEFLNEDSPQSPRVIREALDLQGKFNESAFNKALKELWTRLLIVGYGEIDDGAFPSLAIGSTKLLFEDEWMAAEEMSFEASQKALIQYFDPDSAIFKYLKRVQKSLYDKDSSSGISPAATTGSSPDSI